MVITGHLEAAYQESLKLAEEARQKILENTL